MVYKKKQKLTCACKYPERMIKYFWKPILWLAFICYGLFIPASNIPSKPFANIPHFDKVVHFALFFGLCILLFRPFKKINRNPYFLAPALSIALGLVLEFAQQQITVSRSSDIYDFFANAAGIAFAFLFYRFFVSGKKWEFLF